MMTLGTPRRARLIILVAAALAGLTLAASGGSARAQGPPEATAQAEPGPGLENAGDEPGGEEAGELTPLGQAKEESGIEAPPRIRQVPGGALTVTSSLLAASGDTFRISLELDRAVAAGSLQVRLPARWLADAATSDLPFAVVPRDGRAPGSGIEVSRRGKALSFSFDGARPGDRASFELTDVGIPAGSYELPYEWREPGVAASDASTGSAQVVFFAPTREQGPPDPFSDPTSRLEANATDNATTESETFLTAVPGDPSRFVVGANSNSSGSGFNAWVTNDGGATFTKAPLPSSIDAPSSPLPEASSLCCDPMSAADAAGNIWYGGLSQPAGISPSRIVVSRIAPGASSFGAQTVGLPVRTTGTQDKPLMTIDNSPASPTFGRLYVVWDEPAAIGGINIVVSTCETRPGGVPSPASCDNADNWTGPASVTPASGSYIYADVAVGPGGKVYVTWWNYSSANAIQGDVCDPAAGQSCAAASGWSGTPPAKTIATLDATGNAPLPFACPILAQPGGRAAPSPQVDVDRSGGPDDGRVYVTWGDLRTGSGTTRCSDNAPPQGTPKSTHLSWDSFVASASGALPGSANPSPSVATRLLTDGEGGGAASSDEWFPWLAVDQSTGQVWADFYSTRDDATRRTTNFYVRSVAPSGGAGDALGPLTRVSSAPSDYSTKPCCSFGNDYGDYTGIDASGGIAIPVWSDKRAGADGEAYAFVDAANGQPPPSPQPAPTPAPTPTPAPAPAPTPTPAQPPALDRTAPQTAITKRPKRRSRRRRARFAFSSSEAGSSFACTLDGKPLAIGRCTSPLKLRVKRKRHVFTVSGIDAAGNRDSTPAVATWKVRKKRMRR